MTGGGAGKGPHRGGGGCDRGRGQVGAVEQAGRAGTQGTGTKQKEIVKIVLHS